ERFRAVPSAGVSLRVAAAEVDPVMVRASKAIKNRVRQAEIFDAMWDPEITHNLFPDISFTANLYSTHWDVLFSRYLVSLEGTRVLDIGCGTGWTSLLLAQRGAKVTAV